MISIIIRQSLNSLSSTDRRCCAQSTPSLATTHTHPSQELNSSCIVFPVAQLPLCTIQTFPHLPTPLCNSTHPPVSRPILRVTKMERSKYARRKHSTHCMECFLGRCAAMLPKKQGSCDTTVMFLPTFLSTFSPNAQIPSLNATTPMHLRIEVLILPHHANHNLAQCTISHKNHVNMFLSARRVKNAWVADAPRQCHNVSASPPPPMPDTFLLLNGSSWMRSLAFNNISTVTVLLSAQSNMLFHTHL